MRSAQPRHRENLVALGLAIGRIELEDALVGAQGLRIFVLGTQRFGIRIEQRAVRVQDFALGFEELLRLCRLVVVDQRVSEAG